VSLNFFSKTANSSSIRPERLLSSDMVAPHFYQRKPNPIPQCAPCPTPRRCAHSSRPPSAS
jgi:hypothetical protein